MQTAAQVIALTALLFLAQELLRNAGKWILWSLFLVVPVALTPHWIAVNDFGPFLWIKCYSVFFCMCWGSTLRFTRLGERTWARRTIPLLLAANVLEATVVDLLESGAAHMLNGLVGVLLIATLPYGAESTCIGLGRCRDLRYGSTLRWACGYTLWNWTFVYLNYPSLIGHHTAVLASALIVAAIDSHRWLQTRACTLGFNLLTMATINTDMASWLDSSDWQNESAAIVAAVIAFGFAIGLGVQRVQLVRFSAAAIGEPRVLHFGPADHRNMARKGGAQRLPSASETVKMDNSHPITTSPASTRLTS